jgi:hypothetical protein
MKKITIQEFAKQLRQSYPTKFKNLSDVDLVSKWIKLRPNSVEILKYSERGKLIVDDVLKYTEGEIKKIRGLKKVTSPTDTTKTQQDTTNDNSVVNTVKDKVNDVIDKVKNTSSTSPKPTQTVDSSVFNCIKNSNTKGKNLQQTKDNPEAYSFFNTDGSEFTFWANGDFTYYDGDTTANGKWKCNGGNNFEANVDWKGTTHYYKSETNEWALTQNAKKTVYENTIKKIVSKNLKSLTK